MNSRLGRILKEPKYIILGLINRKFGRLIPDKLYIAIKYRCYLGRWPNLKHPKYLSEKLQWMKLYDHDSLYPIAVDKYAVREYVGKKIGNEYLVPLLGTWDSPEDINWDNLPDQFVLKCTHGSHTNIICTQKSELDVTAAITQLHTWMKDDSTFYYGREWPYSQVKPKIICEKFIESDDPGGVRDYKFMCFDGIADNVMVCSDRQINAVRFDHFDKDWNLLRYQYVDREKPEGYTLDKPKDIDKMFKIAEQLAQDFKFVRVDLYNENDQIYFGELTFFPQSGYDTDYTPETDKYLGTKLILEMRKGDK